MTDAKIDPRAEELIRELRLDPHPESGFFREVFRSHHTVRPADLRPVRAAVTSNVFLLNRSQHSRWHRVQSDEVWHLYEGGPLELITSPPTLDAIERVILGPALVSDGPVHVVPAGWWQAARPVGVYALAGCTVAPGFDFTDFTFLRDDPEALARLVKIDPCCAEFA